MKSDVIFTSINRWLDHTQGHILSATLEDYSASVCSLNDVLKGQRTIAVMQAVHRLANNVSMMDSAIRSEIKSQFKNYWDQNGNYFFSRNKILVAKESVSKKQSLVCLQKLPKNPRLLHMLMQNNLGRQIEVSSQLNNTMNSLPTKQFRGWEGGWLLLPSMWKWATTKELCYLHLRKTLVKLSVKSWSLTTLKTSEQTPGTLVSLVS